MGKAWENDDGSQKEQDFHGSSVRRNGNSWNFGCGFSKSQSWGPQNSNKEWVNDTYIVQLIFQINPKQQASHFWGISGAFKAFVLQGGHWVVTCGQILGNLPLVEIRAAIPVTSHVLSPFFNWQRRRDYPCKTSWWDQVCIIYIYIYIERNRY